MSATQKTKWERGDWMSVCVSINVYECATKTQLACCQPKAHSQIFNTESTRSLNKRTGRTIGILQVVHTQFHGSDLLFLVS